ncbi:hypothetical protein LguiA_004697 [Lonicera macranthoides]
MGEPRVKRIHEYKRQLLNILEIVYRYKKMKEMSPKERKAQFVPRICLFGGKAFATYVQAKRIVKFIMGIGTTINHDSKIGDLLKLFRVARTKIGSKITSFDPTRLMIFTQLWKTITSSSELQMSPHFRPRLHFNSLYNFHVLAETQFSLLDGQNWA